MIDWTRAGDVVELRLAHAPLNEIGTALLDALERFADEVERSAPRAVIVHSGLPGGFCAGADLRELHTAIAERSPGDYLPELGSFLDRIHAVFGRIDALPLTTIGALHGPCFGGGFELALTLDVLVADVTTRFCFPELRLGIVPGFGGVPRLKRELGNAVVRDLILSGRSINAKRAAELGLVSQVVARGEALAVARALAGQCARFEPGVVARAKRFVKPSVEAELPAEKRLFLELFAAPATKAALRRFVESEDAMPYLPAASGDVDHDAVSGGRR